MRIFLLISLLALLYACNNDLSTIGQNLIPNDRYVEFKSFPIDETSTLKLDSFPTSGLTQLTMGKMTDDITGTVITTPYFQLASTGFDPNVTHGSNAVYDSLTLNFTYTQTLAGDTTNYQQFDLYQLADYPRINLDEYLSFSTDSLPWKEKIASLTMYPQKENLAKTYFKVNDEIGLALFEKMKDRDDVFRGDPLDFMEYFKGLAIVPGKNNSNLIGISALSSKLYLRCHYHIGSAEGSFNMPAYSGSSSGSVYTYTNIKQKPTEKFEGITTRSPMPFEKNDIAIIEGLNGYMLRLKVPFIADNTFYRTIVKAEITIRPKLTNFEDIPMPQILGVYLSDKETNFRGILKNMNDNPVIGQLVLNSLNLEDQKYIIDITDFYMNRVEAITPVDQDIYLLIGLPNNIITLENGFKVFFGETLGASFQRAVFEELPILNIYYAQYQ